MISLSDTREDGMANVMFGAVLGATLGLLLAAWLGG